MNSKNSINFVIFNINGIAVFSLCLSLYFSLFLPLLPYSLILEYPCSLQMRLAGTNEQYHPRSSFIYLLPWSPLWFLKGWGEGTKGRGCGGLFFLRISQYQHYFCAVCWLLFCLTWLIRLAPYWLCYHCHHYKYYFHVIIDPLSSLLLLLSSSSCVLYYH